MCGYAKYFDGTKCMVLFIEDGGLLEPYNKIIWKKISILMKKDLIVNNGQCMMDNI